MSNNRVPEHIEKPLLKLYLNDHLAGATGGRSRAHRMARTYTDLPIQAGRQFLLSRTHARVGMRPATFSAAGAC